MLNRIRKKTLSLRTAGSALLLGAVISIAAASETAETKIRMPSAAAVYIPPSAFLPEVLAKFPGGEVTAAEFRAEVRAQLSAVPEPQATTLLRQAAAAAARDMAAFSQKNPGADIPLDKPRLYGWAQGIVMSVCGRDFTWQEAVDFYLREGAAQKDLQMLLTNMLTEKIVRTEASALAPDKPLPPDAPASSNLRTALAPLFTAETLTAYYHKNSNDFLLLKLSLQTAAKKARTVYVAAGKHCAAVPITEYGVDYQWKDGAKLSPVVALPQKTVDAFVKDNKISVIDEDTEYRLLAKLYPRQPVRILPIVADIRLRQEIERLLTAVAAHTQIHQF